MILNYKHWIRSWGWKKNSPFYLLGTPSIGPWRSVWWDCHADQSHPNCSQYGEPDAVCAVCGRLQRTVDTNILYLLCSKSQNELNSNSKFYLLLDLFLTCIKHIDMWLHISFRRSPFHNMHLYVLLTLLYYWNYWNYDSIM